MSTENQTELDVTVTDHGSILLINCHTEEVLEHLQENTGEEAQWWGGFGGTRSLVVEPRYLKGVLNQLSENGFNVPQF